MKLLVLAVTVLTVTIGGCASRQDEGGYDLMCTRPFGVASVQARSDLPPALRDELEGVAMPGEYWNGGDEGPPGQGLLLIWHYGKRWAVIEGHGGFATWFGVRAFDVSDNGRHLAEITIATQTTNLCKVAETYIRP
jgi:hypothetical protein